MLGHAVYYSISSDHRERDIHCVTCIKQSNNSYFKMPNQLSRNVTEYMYRRIFSLLINHQTFDVQFCLHKHNNKNGIIYLYTVEPLLRGHPDESPAPLERPLDNVNLNINLLISTPDERPPLLKGHFSDAKVVASQEGFHCIALPLLSASFVRLVKMLADSEGEIKHEI